MKVMLVTEHRLLQNVLRIALERKEGVEIVGEYLEGQAALAAVGELCPDMVILGMKLPDMDGLTLTEQLKKKSESVRLLALTGQKEQNFLVPFLMLGGLGYMNQYQSDEEFYHAVDDVMAGRIHVSDRGLAVLDEVGRMLADLRERAAHHETVKETVHPTPRKELSERERQVLHLYVNGYSSSEIGGILYMSVNTVETHKKRIKEKLQLNRKAELLHYAIKNGLFEEWD